MDKSAAGAELPMALAGATKKLGINVAGIYGKIAGRGDDAEAQPLIDAVNVLRRLGVDFAYLGEDEPCCGGLLHYIGMQQDFAKNANEVYKKLKSKGVKKIIGIVPSCTYALRDLIPPHVPGYDIQVKHFSEVVAERIGSMNLRYPKEIKVAYHDPCQMARFLKLTDPPRQILQSIKGITLVEPEWTSKEWSTCCGGGGGFEAVFPEMSHVLAVNRAKELADTGAQMVVTHCPGCIMQLKGGLKEIGKEEVGVMDLAQVVAAAIGA
jgi:Fe-S oxidoreductase